jgi:hypothetical protein
MPSSPRSASASVASAAALDDEASAIADGRLTTLREGTIRKIAGGIILVLLALCLALDYERDNFRFVSMWMAIGLGIWSTIPFNLSNYSVLSRAASPSV